MRQAQGPDVTYFRTCLICEGTGKITIVNWAVVDTSAANGFTYGR